MTKWRMFLSAIAVTLRGVSVVKKSISQDTNSGSPTNGFMSMNFMADFLSRISAILAVRGITIALAIFAMAFLSARGNAYMVETSTNTVLEQQMISAISQQFIVQLTTNPFVANTYQLKLLGPNPTYNPPPTIQDFKDIISSMIINAYPYPFVNGMETERWHDISLIGSFEISCSSPTAFNLVQSSTKTFDLGTCIDALSTGSNSIYQQEFSTPTVLSGF